MFRQTKRFWRIVWRCWNHHPAHVFLFIFAGGGDCKERITSLWFTWSTGRTAYVKWASFGTTSRTVVLSCWSSAVATFRSGRSWLVLTFQGEVYGVPWVQTRSRQGGENVQLVVDNAICQNLGTWYPIGILKSVLFGISLRLGIHTKILSNMVRIWRGNSRLWPIPIWSHLYLSTFQSYRLWDNYLISCWGCFLFLRCFIHVKTGLAGFEFMW